MQSHLSILILFPFFLSLLIGRFLLYPAVDTMEGEVLVALLWEDGCEVALETCCQIFVVFGDPLEHLFGEESTVEDLDLRVDCFYGGLLGSEVSVSNKDALAEVVEGKAEVLLIDEFFIDPRDHLQEALVLLLELLLLQMQVDLAIALLLILDLKLLLLGELLEDPPQSHRKGLREALADRLNRFWGFSTKDILDRLLITLLKEFLDLLSQLSRHCSR